MNRLKERRKALGLTMKELCESLRVEGIVIDVPTLCRYEAGASYPTPEQLTSISRLLQTPQSDLYDDLEYFLVEAKKPEYGPITKLLATTIPYGHDNAVSRKLLAMKMGEEDRSLRKHIEAARKEGLPICNFDDGAGYFLSEDLDDLRRQYKKTFSAARKLMAEAYCIKQKILALEDSEDDAL